MPAKAPHVNARKRAPVGPPSPAPPHRRVPVRPARSRALVGPARESLSAAARLRALPVSVSSSSLREFECARSPDSRACPPLPGSVREQWRRVSGEQPARARSPGTEPRAGPPASREFERSSELAIASRARIFSWPCAEPRAGPPGPPDLGAVRNSTRSRCAVAPACLAPPSPSHPPHLGAAVGAQLGAVAHKERVRRQHLRDIIYIYIYIISYN